MIWGRCVPYIIRDGEGWVVLWVGLWVGLENGVGRGLGGFAGAFWVMVSILGIGFIN